MYKELAEYYDLIYHWKDYKAEADTIKEIIEKYKRSDGKTLLDVGCGTGMHVKYFKNDFSCMGIDINNEMVEVARSKINDVVFEQGDMIDEVITQGDKRCVDSFYVHAQQRFREAGINENQIEIKQVASTINIGKTIVEEAKKGDFGTLVIGRRGIDNSFFMGSVSRYILYNASDRAIWLVP